MLAMHRGDRAPTERDQLTLDVRRDCDPEYLRRSEAFMRRSVAAGMPFFVYFNHSLMHMPVIPRADFKGRAGNGDRASVASSMMARSASTASPNASQSCRSRAFILWLCASSTLATGAVATIEHVSDLVGSLDRDGKWDDHMVDPASISELTGRLFPLVQDILGRFGEMPAVSTLPAHRCP